MTYTIEDVIDVINEELDEAYTEASKEEADELAQKGKEWREYFNKDELKKFGDKALPKGDPETVRRKNIRKQTSFGTYIPQRKKDKSSYSYNHPRYEIKGFGANNPYRKKYEELNKKENELQDKIRKKAENFQDKEGKEYEVYYGDKDNKKRAKEFIKKTRSEGKHPITLDAYKKHAFAFDNPEYKKSEKREKDAWRKLDISDALADKAEKGFKNKDVEAKWKKFVDKYQETVESIYKAYEDDIISYESAYELLDLIDLDNYEFED